MSVRQGLLTLPEDGDLLRIPGFLPEGADAAFTRRLLREWPLSRVELAEFPDLPGSPRRIVKSQRTVTSVEGAFYRYAEGIPDRERGMIRLPERLGEGGAEETGWLILSFEDGEAEDWRGLDENAVRTRVREIVLAVNRTFGDSAPVFTDWSAPEKPAEDLESDLPVLRRGGLDPEAETAVRRWIGKEAAACWDAPVGLLHGDLKADNLIRQGERTAVLDWQRPARGPLPLEEELSLLLENREPEKPGSFTTLARLYLAHWYARAYRTCLPWPFVLKQAVRYAAEGIRI